MTFPHTGAAQDAPVAPPTTHGVHPVGSPRYDGLLECEARSGVRQDPLKRVWMNLPVFSTVWAEILSTVWAETRTRDTTAAHEKTTPAGGESGGRHHGPTRGGGAGAGHMPPTWWLQTPSSTPSAI